MAVLLVFLVFSCVYCSPDMTLSVTHSLTPCCRVLLIQLTVAKLFRKFLILMWNLRVYLFTMFTDGQHLFLSRVRRSPFRYSFLLLKCISVLCSYLFPSLTSGFPSKILCAVICSTYLILLEMITLKISGEAPHAVVFILLLLPCWSFHLTSLSDVYIRQCKIYFSVLCS